MRNLIACAAGAIFAVGCASHHTVAKVDDSGLSRLDERQMQPVDDARIEEGRASDAVARAKANEADSRAQVEVAKGDKGVAEAQLKRAAAERDLLKKQYASRDQMLRADDNVKAAQDRVKASDLKMRYLDQLIAVSETERRASEAHFSTAHALTQQAKLRAMKAGNAPQAAAVKESDLDQQLASARAHEADLQKQASEQRASAMGLYNQWRQADSSARVLARPELTPPPPVAPPQR